ncbi:FUN14 domain-containing protein [Candidatus Dependentiae bacterium]
MDFGYNFQSFIDWIKEFWNKINIKDWAESVGGSSSEAVQAAIYFGGGFAIGFLFKKYFKFLFATLFIAIFLVLLLEYNKVLDIDWQAFNVLVGFEPTADVGVILNFVFSWIKSNLLVFVSSAVGFLIGYKLG